MQGNETKAETAESAISSSMIIEYSLAELGPTTPLFPFFLAFLLFASHSFPYLFFPFLLFSSFSFLSVSFTRYFDSSNRMKHCFSRR